MSDVVLGLGDLVFEHDALGCGVKRQRDDEEEDADDEEGAVVDAAGDDFAHFLRDDAGHGVSRLEEHAETFGDVGDRDLVASDEEDDHRFANDAAESEEDRGDDSGEGGRDDDTADGLKLVGTESEGGVAEVARHIVDGVFGESEDGGDGHEGKEAPGRKDVEAFDHREAGHPGEGLELAELPEEFAEDDDAEEAEDDRGNGTDKFDAGLDEVLLARSGDLVGVDRGTDAKGNGEDEGESGDVDGAEEKWEDAVEVVPVAVGDPVLAEDEGGEGLEGGDGLSWDQV